MSSMDDIGPVNTAVSKNAAYTEDTDSFGAVIFFDLMCQVIEIDFQ